ncbi:MAG: hypothetical protein NTU49_06510 [Gammaproteobacteria bacterium]|nr:hypothetical protein [Gammaproteobacteria bacterium]
MKKLKYLVIPAMALVSANIYALHCPAQIICYVAQASKTLYCPLQSYFVIHGWSIASPAIGEMNGNNPAGKPYTFLLKSTLINHHPSSAQNPKNACFYGLSTSPKSNAFTLIMSNNINTYIANENGGWGGNAQQFGQACVDSENCNFRPQTMSR